MTYPHETVKSHKKRREHAIEKNHEQLTTISKKLNKDKLKTKEQIEVASSLFGIDFIEETKIQITPGRPALKTI
ncbi:MAG: hypothetical protein JEZ12_17415 [Desulfobacterium sp.]|nr:hypothetical protein [Desulfobacterium sp.]